MMKESAIVENKWLKVGVFRDKQLPETRDASHVGLKMAVSLDVIPVAASECDRPFVICGELINGFAQQPAIRHVADFADGIAIKV
jgi:hypothetical protein